MTISSEAELEGLRAIGRIVARVLSVELDIHTSAFNLHTDK